MMGGPPSKPPPSAEPPSTEEPTADKAMINVLRVISFHHSLINEKHSSFSKDKAKVARPGRAPRSRNHRVTDAAAASNNDDDNFFSTPTPAPAAVPKVSTPAPPPVEPPVTGLPGKPAAIAAKQTNLKEKKKFSLFDSDDSEIDDLLFGSGAKSTLRLIESSPH